MSCLHDNARELDDGVMLCRACGQVKTGESWSSIALPPRPCCPDCAEQNRVAMDEYAKRQGCHGCKK